MSQPSALLKAKPDTQICGNKECLSPIEEGGGTWVWIPPTGEEVLFCSINCVKVYAESESETLERICGNKECLSPIEEGGDTWVWIPPTGKEVLFCGMDCAEAYAKEAGMFLKNHSLKSVHGIPIVHTLTLQLSTRSITLRPSLS